MKERQELECIREIADMLYHKTGDKWYLSLCIDVTRKLRGRR